MSLAYIRCGLSLYDVGSVKFGNLKAGDFNFILDVEPPSCQTNTETGLKFISTAVVYSRFGRFFLEEFLYLNCDVDSIIAGTVCTVSS